MKRLKTKPIWKAANCEFNEDKIAAWSYGWWQFVKVIQGKIVFNRYRYSVTTAKHQRKVLDLMVSLGFVVDTYIESPHGLNFLDCFKGAISLCENEIKLTKADMIKGRPAKNKVRAAWIAVLKLRRKEAMKLAKAVA